jgi:Cft2 family RNA processing exonuclease
LEIGPPFYLSQGVKDVIVFDPSTLLVLHVYGAISGVTGSCHQLSLSDDRALLVNCGLFQGAEAGSDGARAEQLEIGFSSEPIQALIVTHIQIDHVGRIPYLLAAGYRGPILCSPRRQSCCRWGGCAGNRLHPQSPAH